MRHVAPKACLFHTVLALITALWLTALPLTAAQAQQDANALSHSLQTSGIEGFLQDPHHLVISTEKGDIPFWIELAQDDAERSKGLMYRTKLDEQNGMLFDFGRSAPVSMWMKNTYVSLDMLFIDKKGRIAHLVRNTTPLSESIIGSGGPVWYVLEVKAGSIDKLGIKVGDHLQHQLFTSNSPK